MDVCRLIINQIEWLFSAFGTVLYVVEGAYHFYRREVYGVDRILCDGRIIFDHGVEVRLSRATFKKTFCPAIHSSMRSDNAFCCD